MSIPLPTLQLLLGGSHGDKQQTPLSLLFMSLLALERKQVRRVEMIDGLTTYLPVRSVLTVVYEP